MEKFTTSSEERSRGRGSIEPNELLRLRIVCPESLAELHGGTTGTEQHIMIHDRWLGHVETCDICKEHVMTLVFDLHKRINLFSPTMMQKMMSTVTPEQTKRAMDAAGPEVKERFKEAIG